MSKKSLIIQELFYFLTVLVGVFIILEIIWPNIILAYFNLNYLIILWFIAGLMALAKNPPPIRK